jgi:hypothetical protein
MNRTYLWIAIVGVALAIVAAGIWLTQPSGTLVIHAQDPWVVGNSDDPFSYTGDVRRIPGDATLEVDRNGTGGYLEITLTPDEALSTLLSGSAGVKTVVLRFEFENATNLWTDRQVYGDTGVGDDRLPATHVDFAGTGPFDLRLNGQKQTATWDGFWSLGDALRRSDGSIRNQGLVFTPLLRDQTGFSDPSRTELTLLLNAPDSNDVVLDLVFPDVGSSASASS